MKSRWRRHGDNVTGRKAEGNQVLGALRVLPIVRGHEPGQPANLMGGKG